MWVKFSINDRAESWMANSVELSLINSTLEKWAEVELENIKQQWESCKSIKLKDRRQYEVNLILVNLIQKPQDYHFTLCLYSIIIIEVLERSGQSSVSTFFSVGWVSPSYSNFCTPPKSKVCCLLYSLWLQTIPPLWSSLIDVFTTTLNKGLTWVLVGDRKF